MTRTFLFIGIGSAIWFICSSTAYWGATERFYLAEGTDLPALRVTSPPSGSRYKATAKWSNATYTIEIYPPAVEQNKASQATAQFDSAYARALLGGSAPSPQSASTDVKSVDTDSKLQSAKVEAPDIEAVIEDAVSFYNAHLKSLRQLPYWAQCVDEISPIPIFRVTLCYIQKGDANQKGDSQLSGFRVDWNWNGYWTLTLVPLFPLWLCVILSRFAQTRSAISSN